MFYSHRVFKIVVNYNLQYTILRYNIYLFTERVAANVAQYGEFNTHSISSIIVYVFIESDNEKDIRDIFQTVYFQCAFAFDVLK